MTLSGESKASSSSSSAGGLAQQHYHKVLELEQQLLTTIQSKGPFDPNVRILRGNIRELFEAIILEDHEFADLHDVEQSLWRLHHTRIEEFRGRIRKSMPPAGTASPPASGTKPSVRREPVHKILAVFRSFLSEATGFYHDLILKIRAKHGLSQDDLTYSAINGKVVKDDDKRILELKRCQLSCHRCLIYLGDLARYKEYYGDGDAKNHDWSIAAGFYVKAASLWPASGNPYNQLAVLATYIGDEMLAVYHYFRSLASEAPFLTAKDNLVLLFEKNRHSYLRLVASSSGKPAQAGKIEPVIKGKIKEETQGTGEESAALRQGDSPNSEQKALAADILKSFRVHVVRLNGILFTRTSLETFAEVHSCVLCELEELLNVRDTDEETVSSQVSLTSGRIWGTGPNVLLQLISILIFTVHNINVGPGPDSHQLTYAEILQRPVVLEHAFIAIFECVGYLLQKCAKVDDPSNSLLLPAILVVMEWLSCRPEMALGTEIKEKEGIARMFFWKNCVDLLNKLLTGALGRAVANEDDEGPILWEDFELRGFTPLLPIQHKLDYTKKPAVGLGSFKEKCVRVKRLKHAGKVISNMFKGTGKGLHYDAETDIFYMTGDKKRQERKQADVVLTAETVEPRARSVKEDSQTVTEPDLILTKVAASIEEEDEEVIVFKPSNKLKEPIDTVLLDDTLLDRKDRSSKFVSNTIQSDAWVSSKSMPVSLTASHFTGIEALPTTVALASSSLATSNVQALLSEPASLAADVPGALKDSGGFLAVNSAGLDVIPERSSHFHGPSLEGLSLLDSNSKAPGNEYDHGLLSGSTVDWGSGMGFGMFQNQPARNFMPVSVNWQPQDVKGGSSLWNSELHRFAAARGSFGAPPSRSPVGMGKRFPFMDSSPGALQSMILTGATSNLSESLSMPALSTGSHMLDALVQTKPSFEEPQLVTTDGNLGPLQMAAQDPSISGAKLKPDPGFTIESEKPARRMAASSSGMRPPPGFGPLPIKPPVSLSATSVFQASQPTSSGHPSSTMGEHKIAPDHSGASSVDEHIDDYGWLDGYTPPKKETSQPAASGLGRVVGGSSYGWPTGGFNPPLDATASPFPGMKPSDRFLSPPPQQPPLPHVFLQQELLRKQQTQEQYQQQLLQEHQRQQLQQLYNAQLAAQRNQLPQVEQQNQQQPLQQQPLALQQQMPHPLWPGQNSFVS